MPNEVKRSVRVSARLAKELAWMLARDVKDPRVALVAITRVVMTDDLRSARIFIRLIKDGDVPDRRNEALEGLARASGLLRREVSRRAGLRCAPELRFHYDEGQDERTRIEVLLEEVKAEERARGRS
jgi:ribosome-binding factor A